MAIVCVALAAPHAHAQEPAPEQQPPDPDGPPDFYRKIRELLDQGRYAEARPLLIQAYSLNPAPKLLFALGQVEFNLENFQAAIDYYQKFLDTNPNPSEAALAQQAIGAARARIVAPPPVVIEKAAPKPAYEREWDVWSTSIVSVGGAAAITGAIVAIHGYRMGREDRFGEPANLYRDRLDRSKRWQWTGFGVATAGTLIIGAAFIRFAVRRVEVAPIASTEVVGLAVGRAW